MSKEMTMDEMIDVLARYQYNAKHDADRIKALEFEVSGLDRLRGRYAEAMNEIARLKAEVERLDKGIQPEGSNDAVARAVNVLLEKEKEIARLKAEVDGLRKELADAQENYHIVNEMVAKMLKEGKQS